MYEFTLQATLFRRWSAGDTKVTDTRVRLELVADTSAEACKKGLAALYDHGHNFEWFIDVLEIRERD